MCRRCCFNNCCLCGRCGCGPYRCSSNKIVGPMGPRGPIGPRGPKGEAGGVATSSILVAKNGSQTIPSNSILDLGNQIDKVGDKISYENPNNIILDEGTYFINYKCVAKPTGVNGKIGASLTIDGAAVPEAAFYVTEPQGEVEISLQYMVTLGAGKTPISIQNKSAVSIDYLLTNIFVVKIA